MQITLNVARVLKQLTMGAEIPGSSVKSSALDRLVDEGLVGRRLKGRTRSFLYISDVSAFENFLKNQAGIADLDYYIRVLEDPELKRADSVIAGSSSKLKRVRTFTGFPVNCLEPIPVELRGRKTTLHPLPGAFTFISDFGKFIPDPGVLVCGIENPENFRHIELQRGMFGCRMLFVSRYPQSGDLLKWLEMIPNNYLHFGDFDLAGISIFLNEYRNKLGERASLLIPQNLESLLAKYGNRDLYDRQLHQAKALESCPDPEIRELLELLHRHKKGLEQEVFIGLGEEMGFKI